MNGLDWGILAVLAYGAVRGYMRGLVVEVASLVGVVLGIWLAARYNHPVAAWLGLEQEREAIPFLIVLVGVLALVHLLAKLITGAMDLAMMGLPNKVAGLFFGALRTAFLLSVLLSLATAFGGVGGLVAPATLEGSRLYAPLRAFAPTVVPALPGSCNRVRCEGRKRNGSKDFVEEE
jgi:membrane protein required for colicin V production